MVGSKCILNYDKRDPILYYNNNLRLGTYFLDIKDVLTSLISSYLFDDKIPNHFFIMKILRH